MNGRGMIRRRRYAPRFALAGAVLVGLGWLMRRMPAQTPGRQWWPWLMMAGGLLLVGVFMAWRHGRGGSSGLVNRWSRRSRRNDGVASWWAILRVASGWAMRRKASVLRPSLRGRGWRGWFVSAREVATPLARVGLLRVWSPIEDVTLRIGGPRTGKTGELAGRILDAPGAVIATSTRTDLVELCAPVRSLRGPVRVFNPSGVGTLRSTIAFDPLSGCQRPTTATTRAADLLAGVDSPSAAGGDREFWAGQARRVLASLMHAAALGGCSMREVLAWVADPDSAAAEVSRYLRRSPEPAYESDALQFLNTNERTRSSICATIMPALGWLTDSVAAAATRPAEDGAELDVAELLARRGTVFMLGAEDAQVAPLVTAFTGHIAREARRIAGQQRGGRLDPPLTLALDEAALICPVPLDNWTADMGGRNVTIHIAVQSRAQLRQRWGDTGAAAILNNTATILLYGGTRDPDDLAAYSMLSGERDEDVPTWDHEGRVTAITTRRVPMLSPSQIAQLPARHVVIIRRGLAPAIGRVQMAWKRSDVRGAQRSLRWERRIDLWTAATVRFAEWIEARGAEAAAVLAPLLARVRDRVSKSDGRVR